MADFARLRAQLNLHERRMLVVYDDATGKPIVPGTLVKGYPSIGIGRNLVHKGLTVEESDYLLTNDLADALAAASRYAWFDRLDTVRQNVVLELLFNLGATRFRAFKDFIRYMSEHRWPHAAKELDDSLWQEQVDPILGDGKGRADVLIQMVLTGDWPK